MTTGSPATHLQEQDVWPGLVSVIVPLVQLVSVVVVGLSDTFHVAALLLFPEILNLVNLLTMLSTIAVIGWFWYWRNNLTWVGWKTSQPTNRTFDQTKVELLLRCTVFSSPAFLILFVVVTIFLKQGLWANYSILWGIFQYISYSLLLILSGLAIYIWIYEFIRKKQTFQREDFTRNLLVTLAEYNLVPRPNVTIYRNFYTQGMNREVEIEIDGVRYVLVTSLDGLEIISTYQKNEFEQLKNQPSIGELQVQIQTLLSQISALQNKPPEENKAG